MSRPRGNKPNEFVYESRKLKAAEKGPVSGPAQEALAKELNISARTLRRYFRLLRKQFSLAQQQSATFGQKLEHHNKELNALEDAILQGLPPSISKPLIAISRERAKIGGFYSPTQSFHSVTVSHRAGDLSSHQIVDELLSGLDDESYKKVIDFILELRGSQAPVLEAEQAEEKSGLLGLPAPLHSYKADGEDE